MLLSGAFLLALALLGVLVAATGGGSSGGQPARTPTAGCSPGCAFDEGDRERLP